MGISHVYEHARAVCTRHGTELTITWLCGVQHTETKEIQEKMQMVDPLGQCRLMQC